MTKKYTKENQNKDDRATIMWENNTQMFLMKRWNKIHTQEEPCIQYKFFKARKFHCFILNRVLSQIMDNYIYFEFNSILKK